MQSKFLYTFFLCLLSLSSCKGQDRLDLSIISFDTPNLPIEEKPIIDEYTIYPPSIKTYKYRYKNLEKFCFNGFNLNNAGVNPISSDLAIYVNDKQDSIISLQISIRNNKDSEDFFNFLESKYGKPIVLESEPTEQFEGKPFGNASYLWKNILPNRSVFAYKIYHISNKTQWKYDLLVSYIPTEDNYKFDYDSFKINSFEINLIQSATGIYIPTGNEEELKQYINSLPNAQISK